MAPHAEFSREESEQFEAKRSLAEKREALEALNGMLNTDLGVGTVVFGIDPSGEVVGVEPGNLDKAQRSLSQHIQEKFSPAVVVSLEMRESANKKLLVLRGRRPRALPYFEYDGRAFIREGTATRQLSLDEKQHLSRARGRDHHTGPWRCDRCGDVTGTLSAIVVSDQGVMRSWKHSCGGEWWPAT